jgi:hypothetical protein
MLRRVLANQELLLMHVVIYYHYHYYFKIIVIIISHETSRKVKTVETAYIAFPLSRMNIHGNLAAALRIHKHKPPVRYSSPDGNLLPCTKLSVERSTVFFFSFWDRRDPLS